LGAVIHLGRHERNVMYRAYIVYVDIAVQTLTHTHEIPGTESEVGENDTIYTL
jgi:hypothetical protein